MSETLTARATPATTYPVPKLILAIAVALIGDRLLDDCSLGISVMLFLGLLGVAVVAANPLRGSARDRWIGVLVLFAGLLPLVESVGALSVLFGVLGLALFAAAFTGSLAQGLPATSAAIADLMLVGPMRLAPDLLQAARHSGPGMIPRRATLLGWIVPLLLSGIFASLFASANPLIDGWFQAADWSWLVPTATPPHILFWLALLSIAWAFVSIRPKSRRVAPDNEPLPPTPAGGAAGIVLRLLDAGTVLRCLVLFNLLFAVQSALDVAYLWGGIALPTGVTYAAYAHRGAYPLIATALLAAGFVLAALRPGGPGEDSKAVRWLVYLWIGQNVLLVVSSLLRLDLYVAVYSLTIPRVAAFVWMWLVGIGLVLILARIALRRSNTWLINANGVALAATLYICAFVDVPALVAEYNVTHSWSDGRTFDIGYTMNLGPAVIPALDQAVAINPDLHTSGLVTWRNWQAAGHLKRMDDWRAWTFRDQRLAEYLRARPSMPMPSNVR